jgi:hypothetical protein
MSMNTWEARERARNIYGPEGTARAVRFIDSQGHYAFDYRIGTVRNGRFFDRARGASYEKAFDQAQRIRERKAAVEARRADMPTDKQRLLEKLLAERMPVFRGREMMVAR